MPANFIYPQLIPDPPQITKLQIKNQVQRLSPYKAYGSNSIANMVLQRCLDLIILHLLHIFQATLKLGTYYGLWKESITVVLRKPGKPNYEISKAYRPIILLSTITKVLTAIVAMEITCLIEQHQLLSKTHFGGRPGCTTSDAIHYLVHHIKDTWRRGKVVSILFLDIKGAFPNTVTKRLIHNLKRRRISNIYITFITNLLTERHTKLKFNDFISELINILNGIGQGDPLSMILYIFYNTDLLKIIGNEEEDALGYVDDITLVATGNDLEETTKRLKCMMTKEDGGLQWSREHNSKFEVSKLVILHATRKTQPDPEDPRGRILLDKPPLVIKGQQIQEVGNFKYLGVQINAQFNWKEQAQRVTTNATSWIMQYRRLTKSQTDVGGKLIRQLYLAVALLKITYRINTWYAPPHKAPGTIKNTGSVGVLRALQRIQRVATLAITGALHTTPTDLLDAYAGLLPMELTLSKACHRTAVRILTLPNTHPLHRIARTARHRPPKKHLAPLDHALATLKIGNAVIETIIPITNSPPPAAMLQDGDTHHKRTLDRERRPRPS